MPGSALSFQGHQVRREIVDFGIGVGPQHIAMRLQRVVNLDLGGVAIAANGVLRAIGIGEDNDEVVDADQTAIDLAAGRSVTVTVVGGT